jgi:hypothetical protein
VKVGVCSAVFMGLRLQSPDVSMNFRHSGYLNGRVQSIEVSKASVLMQILFFVAANNGASVRNDMNSKS